MRESLNLELSKHEGLIIFVPLIVTIIIHIHQQVHTIYIKLNYTYTWILLYVSAKNRHPKGDITQRHAFVLNRVCGWLKTKNSLHKNEALKVWDK